MTKITKVYCDVCGKDITEIAKNRPPWEPDLCIEDMAEYRKRNPLNSTYTSTIKDSDIRVWQ